MPLDTALEANGLTDVVPSTLSDPGSVPGLLTQQTNAWNPIAFARFRKGGNLTPDNDNVCLVSVNEVARLTSLSRTMIHRYRKEGNFPASIRLGERRIGFVKSEVTAWIANRVAARAVA